MGRRMFSSLIIRAVDEQQLRAQGHVLCYFQVCRSSLGMNFVTGTLLVIDDENKGVVTFSTFSLQRSSIWYPTALKSRWWSCP